MWPTLILFQCLFVAASVGQFHTSTGIIKLKSGGIVRGSLVPVNSDATRNVFYYAGIPYGKADRFEKAQAAPVWSDTFNATEEGASCPQRVSAKYALLQGSKIDESSCLVLNVWRPASWKTFRAVIFYIHPGAFTSGSIFAPINDAKHFVERGDVIVVAPNYRLGPFGFSAFDDKDSVTNLGMHDLLLALQWCKQNVAQFGGDPNFVTIMGSSSGSAAAGALVLSPLAAGLFKTAILLSGAPNSVFGVTSKAVALQRTTELATDVGCPSDQPIKECLKKKTAIELVAAIGDDPKNFSLFTPLYGDDFLPLSPFEALKSGNFNRKIDLLFGMNEVDGGELIALQNPELADDSAKLTVERAKEILKATFKKFGGKINADEVSKQYIDSLSSPTSEQLKIAISRAFGDFIISCPLSLFGQSLARHEPSSHYYCYRLAQRSLVSDLMHLPGWLGALHGEDLNTLFNYPPMQRDVDKRLREDFTRAVIAFIKTGNAGQMGQGAKWEEAFQGKGDSGSSSTRYMRLNVTDYRMAEEKTCATFWKDRIEL